MLELGLPMTGAEIGCAEGYFSADLLHNGLETLLMVDNWGTIPGQKGDGANDQAWHDKNYWAAMLRVKNYKGAIVLRGLSVDMSRQVEDNSLGLVYIDCDHSYEGVKADINAWYPKLVKGGILAFHDYEARQYGVKQAVTEFANLHGFKIYLLPENKQEDAGAYVINQ